jgi:hypothetical protein
MTNLLRSAFVGLGGIVGFCAGGAGWFLGWAWWARQLGEKYPPAGDVNMPSPRVFDAALVCLVGAPFAAVVGEVLGGFLVRWLVVPRCAQPESPSEPEA